MIASYVQRGTREFERELVDDWGMIPLAGIIRKIIRNFRRLYRFSVYKPVTRLMFVIFCPKRAVWNHDH